LAELKELHVCVARVEDERTAEVRELSVLIIEASNALVDLEMLHIRDVPQLPKTAQEVPGTKRLREEHASDAGPWD
jgi:hypothetical protein